MGTQITLESFNRLLEEDCFVDYLNKFLCLPLFGQRVVYRKKQSKYLIEPSLPNGFDDTKKTSKITEWIWKNRLVFFFRSHIYAEYKLSKALIEFDLIEDGGVEENIARTLEDLQEPAFSKMSNFAKFCKFLSKTTEGLKLVAFFIAAQHVLVSYYDGDPDVVIYIGDLRDRFFDDTSSWCLPKKVLANLFRSEQSTSVAFCMTISQRVLSRICFYWLPRFLLQIKIENERNNLGRERDCRKSKYLHELLGRIETMSPEHARASISTTGFGLLSQNPMTSNKVLPSRVTIKLEDELFNDEYDFDRPSIMGPTRESLTEMASDDMFGLASTLGSINEESGGGGGGVPFPSLTEGGKNNRKSIFQARKESRINEHRMNIRQMSKNLHIPGLEIKVERRESRRKSSKNILKHLASEMSTQRQSMQVEIAKKRDEIDKLRQTALNPAALCKQNLQLENTQVSNVPKRKETIIGSAGNRQSTMKQDYFKSTARATTTNRNCAKPSKGTLLGSAAGMAKKSTSIAALTIRASNVSKAVNTFKNKTARTRGAKSSTAMKTRNTHNRFSNAQLPIDQKVLNMKITADNVTVEAAIEEKPKSTSPGSSPTKDGPTRESEMRSSKSSRTTLANQPTLAQVVTAKKMASMWRKKPKDEVKEKEKSKMTSLKSVVDKIKQSVKQRTNRDESSDEAAQKDGVTKVVFAMSNQRKEGMEGQTIKVLKKNNNRLTEDVEQIEESDDAVPVPDQYLRKRRNAMPKIKPLRTLRKRPHSNMPRITNHAAQSQNNQNVPPSTPGGNENVGKNSTEKPGTADDKRGKRKADFIRKALMVGSTHNEKISAPENDDDGDSGYGDGYTTSFYPVYEDHIYRHEMRHLKAALRSDDFAAGPFMFYLTDHLADEMCMITLVFWQEVERFREEFSGMQQCDLQLELESIISKYVLNDKGIQYIPGMKEVGGYLLDINIQNSLTFPWPLRLLQRKAMEHLNSKWKEFLEYDVEQFYETLSIDPPTSSEPSEELVDRLIKSVELCFATEILPTPLPHELNETDPLSKSDAGSDTSLYPCSATTSRQSLITPPKMNEIGATKRRSVGRPEGKRLSSAKRKSQGRRPDSRSQKSSQSNSTNRSASSNSNTRCASSTGHYSSLSTPQKLPPPIFARESESDHATAKGRYTIGHRHSQTLNKTRSQLITNAMARRTKRAYLLAEQTCRITANLPHAEGYVTDESDDEGFLRPRPMPVYLRPPQIEMKTLALLSSREYPSSNPKVKKTAIIRNTTSSKAPTYMKQTIRKNGALLKRPVIRPKHLVDCLRDPVHFEFFRRYAKAFHFERSVRFWKSVEVMKHVDDPKIRQMKIRMIVNQYFSKGATTGVGVDGQVMREIMRTSPEKVNVSMLISAQACVMKSLEDMWGDLYLSTFTDVKKSYQQKERMDRHEKMTLAQNKSKMTNIWRVFSAFIRRGAKFISCMKRAKLRQEFELYLQTVGRDPSVYQQEGWIEIAATSIDSQMTPEVMYHQKKQQGRLVIAELLINDFRFWCEVECYRAQAENVQQNGEHGEYDAVDEENLHQKAILICDQFLQSNIAPKCRINIQCEISSTVIENVKLGMFDRSLFHDLTINIFPLLLNYWKIFCDRRHKYVPRTELRNYKREMVAKRRNDASELSRKVRQRNIIARPRPGATGGAGGHRLAAAAGPGGEDFARREMNSVLKFDDAPLIDYCDKNFKYFKNSWTDVTKTYDDYPTMNFSLSSGVRMCMPIKPKSMFGQQPSGHTSRVSNPTSRPIRTLAEVANKQKQRIQSAKIIDQLKNAAAAFD